MSHDGPHEDPMSEQKPNRMGGVRLAKHIPTNLRYVAYCNEWGVYLGEWLGLEFWSRLETGDQPTAPTFTIDEYNDFIRRHAEKKIELPKDIAPCQVFPDRPDYHASQDACSNALLPRWEIAFGPKARGTGV